MDIAHIYEDISAYPCVYARQTLLPVIPSRRVVLMLEGVELVAGVHFPQIPETQRLVLAVGYNVPTVTLRRNYANMSASRVANETVLTIRDSFGMSYEYTRRFR